MRKINKFLNYLKKKKRIFLRRISTKNIHYTNKKEKKKPRDYSSYT